VATCRGTSRSARGFAVRAVMSCCGRLIHGDRPGARAPGDHWAAVFGAQRGCPPARPLRHRARTGQHAHPTDDENPTRARTRGSAHTARATRPRPHPRSAGHRQRTAPTASSVAWSPTSSLVTQARFREWLVRCARALER
jgi:hypothetical protein